MFVQKSEYVQILIKHFTAFYKMEHVSVICCFFRRKDCLDVIHLLSAFVSKILKYYW